MLQDGFLDMGVQHLDEITFSEVTIVHPLDGHYIFNLYYMQPSFYLILLGWCLSALCFIFYVV